MAPTQQPERPHFDAFKATLASFQREISTNPFLRSHPIALAFIDWLLRAISAGLDAIEADPTRWLPTGSMPANMFGGDTFVFNEIEEKLGTHDDPDVRRLMVAYHAMLTSLDAICAHLQQLAAQNLDELPWLVAGALWVEWWSGQPGADALRSSLESLRASRSDFDSQLAARAQAASGAVADLLRIAQSILADRTAVLPRPS